MSSSSVSLISLLHGDQENGTNYDFESFFSSGSFFESFEHIDRFCTLHISSFTDQELPPNFSNKHLSFSSQRFRELSHFQSNSELTGPKCCVILGFQLLAGEGMGSCVADGHQEEGIGGKDYFLANWEELSGLGNLLLFLSKNKFSVSQVTLLQNIEELVEKFFNYIVKVEVVFEEAMLIYLLDYVQRAREGRNSGHISVYQETRLDIGVEF